MDTQLTQWPSSLLIITVMDRLYKLLEKVSNHKFTNHWFLLLFKSGLWCCLLYFSILCDISCFVYLKMVFVYSMLHTVDEMSLLLLLLLFWKHKVVFDRFLFFLIWFMPCKNVGWFWRIFSSFVVLMPLQLTRWPLFVVLVKFTKPPVKVLFESLFLFLLTGFHLQLWTTWYSHRYITEWTLD